MKIEQLYSKFKECKSVSTDSRKIEKNTMYFALKGDNFDGNEFAYNAFKEGSKYCVIDDPQISKENPDFIFVDNVLATLQDLARYHRTQLKHPIIGLTGSNGKTTTKELIHAVLLQKYNVKATIGNLNNHIGVPLTLLNFDTSNDFGIVEMGANHQKEIEFLSSISQPDYGLITNFGKAHLEGFGGVEGVIKGKSELYDYIKKNSKIAFINSDDKKQFQQIGNYKNVISFGSNSESEIVITLKRVDPYVTVEFENLTIESQLIGTYNFGNIAAAIAIGSYFKIEAPEIKKAIENYCPKNNRSQIIEKEGNKIILDAYNANPTSMLAALQNFKALNEKSKYLFLGDMFELGNEAEKEHQGIVDYVEANFFHNIFFIGENFFSSKTAPSTSKYKDFEELKPILKSLKLNEATLLIKGSRGMALERILEFI